MSYLQKMIEVRAKEPRQGIVAVRCENSPYVSYSGNMKSCHLCSGSEYDEDCYYGFFLYNSKDTADCAYTFDCTLCYDCLDCHGCYNTNHSQDCRNCTDCSYLFDCTGCNNCFCCVDQKRQQHMIFNKKVDPDKYEEEVKKLKEHFTHEELVQKLEDAKLSTPKRDVHQLENHECTGDYVYNSKCCTECYDVRKMEDCMYCQTCEELKDCLDMSNSYYKSELCYEVMSEMELYNCNFCVTCFYSNDLEYCENVHNSHHCFGCFSMNHAEYCIFNEKVGSLEEWEKKVAEIKAEMKDAGEYGRHLPSTYKYEDSNATMFWPEPTPGLNEY